MGKVNQLYHHVEFTKNDDLGPTIGPIKGPITRGMMRRIEKTWSFKSLMSFMGFKCYFHGLRKISRFDGFVLVR